MNRDCGMFLNAQFLHTNSLINMMTRFRREPVVIMVDKTMLHQVRVPAEDMDLLRFLWRSKGDLSQELMDFRMKVQFCIEKMC